MYIFGQDNRFHQVLQLEQVSTISQKLHGGIVVMHFPSYNIVQKSWMMVISGQQWIETFMNTIEHVTNAKE